MNEKPWVPSEEELRAAHENIRAGIKLAEADREDPERGPIVEAVRAVYAAAETGLVDGEPLSEAFVAFRDGFAVHFGKEEARRYRLYHVIIGSTPTGASDLFDAEGEWSIAAKMREFKHTYAVGGGGV